MREALARSAELIDHFCVYNYRAIRAKFGCLATALEPTASRRCLSACTNAAASAGANKHDQEDDETTAMPPAAVARLMATFRRLALNGGNTTTAERYLAESCE